MERRTVGWARALLAAGLACLFAACAPAAPSEDSAGDPAANAVLGADSMSLGDDLYVKRIADDLWLHVSTRELDGRPAPSNGEILCGPKGAILVDTPWEDDQTARLLDWIDEMLQFRVIAAVVTHFHDDRMGGIRTLHARGIPTWGSALTAERARKEGDPPPQHTFRDQLGLSTGLDSLDVFYPGPAHTRDNVVVWLPRRHLLIGGCMVRSAHTRSLGFTGEADLEQWPRSLAKVRARCPDAEVVIPGHGPVGGMDAIENTERLLRENAGKR